MAGRLTRYSDEAYAAVIADIAAGIPLANALGGPTKPGRTRFFERLKSDLDLARQYEAAREMRADGYVDKLLEINEKLMQGKIDPQSARAASENYKWIASRASRRYADRQTTELTGANGKDLVPEQPRMSDFETARLVAHLLDKGSRAAIAAGDLVALPKPDSAR